MKPSQIVPALVTIGALGWASISDGASPEHHVQTLPTETGQSAFAVIAEIVAILDAEPNIDWSSVYIDALREHLIDMDELTLRAHAQKRRSSAGWK